MIAKKGKKKLESAGPRADNAPSTGDETYARSQGGEMRMTTWRWYEVCCVVLGLLASG